MNLRVYGRKNYAEVEIHPNLQMDSMLVTVFKATVTIKNVHLCRHDTFFV